MYFVSTTYEELRKEIIKLKNISLFIKNFIRINFEALSNTQYINNKIDK